MWRDTWLIAANGLRRSLRDRSILIQGLIAPILIAVVVGAALGAGFSVNVGIGIADADRSDVSRQIIDGLIGAGDDGISFSAVSDPAGVDAAVDTGTHDAVIVLPKGLGERVFSSDPVHLDVVGHAMRPLAQAVAESVASGVAADLQTARITAAAATDAGLADVGTAIQRAAGTPPPLTVDQGEVEGTFSVMAYFAPGIAMMFLFFIIGDGARSIVAERDEGTLARILAAPVHPAAVLLGKTASVMIVGIVSLSAVWLVTSLAFGAEWGDPLGVLLVIIAAVTAICGISLLLTGLARSQAAADALTTIVALLFAVAGGTFFYGSSGALSTLRVFTPNGQALAAFVDLSAARVGALEVMPRSLLLLGIGVATAIAGLLALRNKVLA